MLAAKPAQHAGEDPAREHRQRGERDQPGERDERRPGRGAVDREEHDGERDAGDVLEDAPAEQRLLGLGRRRAATAPRDVDDDDARRQRDAEPDRPGSERRQSGQGRGPGRDRRRDDRLERGDEEQLSVLAPESGDVDLDADLEQEQHDAEVGEQLKLLVVGDVAGRERRHEHADREVAHDRRQAQPTCDPAGERRDEQEQPELEDRERRRIHSRIVRGPERAKRPTGRCDTGFRARTGRV